MINIEFRQASKKSLELLENLKDSVFTISRFSFPNTSPFHVVTSLSCDRTTVDIFLLDSAMTQVPNDTLIDSVPEPIAIHFLKCRLKLREWVESEDELPFPFESDKECLSRFKSYLKHFASPIEVPEYLINN